MVYTGRRKRFLTQMNMKLIKKDRGHLELSFLKKFTYVWHKGCCMSCKNHPLQREATKGEPSCKLLDPQLSVMKEKWHDCGGGYQLYRRPNTSYCTFRSSLPINTALNNFNRNDTTTVKAINFIDVQTRVTARFEKASIWAASFSPSKFN